MTIELPPWLKVVTGKLEEDELEPVSVLLSEPIGFDGWEGMSARRFGEVLGAIPRGKPVDLQINTMGGLVPEGIAMCNMVEARGNVTCRVIGYAASMGAVLLQAGV